MSDKNQSDIHQVMAFKEHDAVLIARFLPRLLHDGGIIESVRICFTDIARDRRDVILDFCNVSYADSEFLSALMQFASRMKKNGNRLVAARVTPELHNVFAITGMRKRVTVVRDIPDALLEMRRAA